MPKKQNKNKQLIIERGGEKKHCKRIFFLSGKIQNKSIKNN
jgi:hypothetical protein